MKRPVEPLAWRWPRPGPVLGTVMLLVLGLWVTLAVGINWGGADPAVVLVLAGNTRSVLAGELWRLVTAPLVHDPQSYGHLGLTLLGLYFLSPSLEQAWGKMRFGGFLLGSALLGYGLQVGVELILPPEYGRRLVGEYWFGMGPVLTAIAVAWARSFRGRTVNLMLLVPVSSGVLLWFVVGASLLALAAGELGPSGLVAPWGGMLSGWLLGGSTPSAWRRAWLELRLWITRRRLRRLGARGRGKGRAPETRSERSGEWIESGAAETESPDQESGGGRVLH